MSLVNKKRHFCRTTVGLKINDPRQPEKPNLHTKHDDNETRHKRGQTST